MSRKTRTILAIAIAAAFVGFKYMKQHSDHADAAASAAAPVPVTPVKPLLLGKIAFKPCNLSSPMGRDSLEAQCATFAVPEDRAKPDGRKIDLNIAWLEATNRGEVMPDPVFFLAGGPGQAAVETYPLMDPVFTEVRKRRAVILVDQRGTGKSNLLNCDGADDETAPDLSPDAIKAEASKCVEALSKKADLSRYTTTDAIADLDAVRQAIGAAQVNLVGVSYGTRVAQQYAMRYPQSTRSIVLDSVVPNTLELGNIFARNLDDSLALQFGLCSKDPVCKAKLGDPRAELDVLLTRLRANPVTVQYRDATSGEPSQGVLRAETVAGLVRMYAYMPLASGLLPKLIHEANQGHYEGLMALTQMLTGDMKDSMAMGMQMSVVCSEDAESMVVRAEDAGTVLGNVMPKTMATMCEVWPKSAPPADFHKPLATKVPALVLEGEFDPVTPPRYGEEVVKTLPNGRLFVLKGQGHSVLPAGCMPKLFAQFVEKADARALDGKCLDALGYAYPFTTFNGAEP
ncbi:alpha/beta fold hydrolase [Thermomonas sp. HDW16]|uniref:alpha/beta fold hydrolase n=1 Tax=Thermomonas sp. HDW16 TaxID=2714945 RepID=UPI0014078E02|nr:alpha/beta fold hydrolase [Thermomonas sp. HDW16]QIL19472.1 alpha/beta hydrolase [Thermomonas sp. HDW16]